MSRISERVVIALGGNALVSPEGRGELGEQLQAVRESACQIAQILAEGAQAVITHGNGPQVGNLLIQQEEGKRWVPPQPLDVCVAMTQGQIGYLLQQALQSALKERGLAIPVVTVVTQVLVDPRDPAFGEPTKPIGPFYSEQEAEELRRTKGYVLKRVGNGERPFRRVVPSPAPLGVVEEECVRQLVEAEHVVIACGGGGVPVVETPRGLEGVEAVIDKDLASERLATALGADTLLILTDVERVALRYGTPEQVDLEQMTAQEARRYLEAGEFPPGSMGPKVEAAVKFVENGGRRAVIASLTQAVEALRGRAGTTIVK